MRVVPSGSEDEPSVGGEPVNVLVRRAAVAYSEGRRDDCAAGVKELAGALDGPYFSFLRAVHSSVDDVLGPGGSLDDRAMADQVVAEAVHRMVFVRSKLLSRQLLADGSSIDGYDVRSDAARLLGPDEDVPEGWVVHQQGLPNDSGAPTDIFVAYDPTRVMEPIVAPTAPNFELLGLLYERGVVRVAGDVDCRVFAASVDGPISAERVVEQGARAASQVSDNNVELGL